MMTWSIGPKLLMHDLRDGHPVNNEASSGGPIGHEASDTEGVTRWKSSRPARLAEATR